MKTLCDKGWKDPEWKRLAHSGAEIKGMFQVLKNGFPFPWLQMERSSLGKGNPEKVRCGEERDFHSAAENIHSFFAGLIVCGWWTYISAHKLSTLILNSVFCICISMS